MSTQNLWTQNQRSNFRSAAPPGRCQPPPSSRRPTPAGRIRFSHDSLPIWSVFPLPGAEGLALAHILAVVLGVVVTLLLVGVVIVVVIRSRRRGPQRPEVKMVYDKGSSGSPSGRGQETATDSEEANPDVIPVNDGEILERSRPCVPARTCRQ